MEQYVMVNHTILHSRSSFTPTIIQVNTIDQLSILG